MTKTTELFILIWVTRSKIKKNIIVGFVIKGFYYRIQIDIDKRETNTIVILCCGKDIYTLFMISVNFDIKPLFFDIG
jgi:hypothetical protein